MGDIKIKAKYGKFVIPKKTANSNMREIVIKPAHPDKYDVYQKDLPADLPGNYTWINNFGVKARKIDLLSPLVTADSTLEDPFPTFVETYIIEFDDIDGKEPVYFNGLEVKHFPAGKKKVGNNRIQVSLDLGDPPVGWP
jgi:hypothetical protein